MYTGLKAGVNEKMAGAAARRAIQSGTTIDSNRLTSLRINYTHHEVRSYGICIANFTLGTAGSIFFLSARSCLPRVVPKLHRWKPWRSLISLDEIRPLRARYGARSLRLRRLVMRRKMK
jgi:hypothetical protein